MRRRGQNVNITSGRAFTRLGVCAKPCCVEVCCRPLSLSIRHSQMIFALNVVRPTLISSLANSHGFGRLDQPQPQAPHWHDASQSRSKHASASDDSACARDSKNPPGLGSSAAHASDTGKLPRKDQEEADAGVPWIFINPWEFSFLHWKRKQRKEGDDERLHDIQMFGAAG